MEVIILIIASLILVGAVLQKITGPKAFSSGRTSGTVRISIALPIVYWTYHIIGINIRRMATYIAHRYS